MELALLVLILVVLLALTLITGVPIALGLLLAGMLAFVVLEGTDGLQFVGGLPWEKSFSYELSAVPLFVLMGQLLSEAGVIRHLMRMFVVWLGWIPGALGIVTIFTAGVFSAMSGSAAATAASLGTVIKPEAVRYGYRPRLILGTLNGGAALDPLIPPSIAMIVYGSLTETSVAQLYAAGMLPGILAMAMMVGYVVVRTTITPELAPRFPATTWRERLNTLWILPPVGIIVFVVLGGIFLGWFTPTESAAVGSALSLAFLLARKDLRAALASARRAVESASVTASFILFMIIAGAIYSHTLAYFGLPQLMGDVLTDLGLDATALMLVLILVLFVLGMFLDSLTMQIITVPFLLPTLAALQIDLIWFGVFVVLMVEIGTMTPPFGIHIFILQGVTRASYKDAVLGAAPFAALLLVVTLLVLAFPELALWLPRQLGL